jgi:hypothetical protein
MAHHFSPLYFVTRLVTRPTPVAGGLVDLPEDLCECGHPGYDGHDMRQAPPRCFTPLCDCGIEPWDTPEPEPEPIPDSVWDEPKHGFTCHCVRCFNQRASQRPASAWVQRARDNDLPVFDPISTAHAYLPER